MYYKVNSFFIKEKSCIMWILSSMPLSRSNSISLSDHTQVKKKKKEKRLISLKLFLFSSHIPRIWNQGKKKFFFSLKCFCTCSNCHEKNFPCWISGTSRFSLSGHTHTHTHCTGCSRNTSYKHPQIPLHNGKTLMAMVPSSC